MRSLFRNVFLAAVAVLALGGIATATASAALPEIVNSKGAELVKNKFTGEVHGSAVVGLELHKRGSESCNELSFAGGVKGTKGGEATLTLHCAATCHTKSAKEKELKLPVSVNLVWLNKAKENLALLLSLPGVVDLEGFCWGHVFSSLHPLELSGSLLVPVAKNELGTEHPLYAKQSKGFQEFVAYENEAGEKVTAELETTNPAHGSEWINEPMGVETGFTMKFEEATEFKA